MMLVKQTPWLLPPRAIAIPQADNLQPALTTKQISEIASIFDPIVEDELAKARTAWAEYQSTRKRDAVYGYLSAVFQIVAGWKRLHCAKARSHQALSAAKKSTVIKSEEPFAVVIFCTSDSRKVDAKTRSKWSRALRYAERHKGTSKNSGSFVFVRVCCLTA